MVWVWQHIIYNALTSRALPPLIAIVAAAGAFIIYYIHRRDSRRDAANIILLEIENAEKLLEEAKKNYTAAKSLDPPSISFPENLRLMKIESWTKYKYLFVKYLEPEEWEEISNFYVNCQLFDEALEHIDSFFRHNESEIRANIQRNVATYAKNLADDLTLNPDNDPDVTKKNNELINETKTRKDVAIQANLNDLVYIYTPKKYYQDAETYFNRLSSNISKTQTGQTLKRLARRTAKRRKLWT